MEGGGVMQFEQGNNLPRVKMTNQSSILRMVYHCGPITRADIAKRLDLTLPTITTNINAMISACWTSSRTPGGSSVWR